VLWTGESCQTNEDGRSEEAVEGDASSVKSDDVEVDDDNEDDNADDDDDMGIVFTVPATVSVQEGKYCQDKTLSMEYTC